MIVYAVICRLKDAAILVDCAVAEDMKGNAPQVTTTLMQQFRDQPNLLKDGDRKTLVHRNEGAVTDFFYNFLEACSMAISDDEIGGDGAAQEHYFHLFFKDGVIYCCISDDTDSRDQKVNFAFLDHIHQEFTKMYRRNRIARANAYALDKAFQPTMRSAMHYYSINRTKLSRDENMQKRLAQVEDIKKVLGRNIQLLIQRGEKLDELVDKASELEKDAKVFKKKARILAEKKRHTDWLLVGVIVIMIILFFLAIVMSFCGVGLQYCRDTSH